MRIHTIWYWVADFDTMVEFYRNTLGLNLRKLDEEGGWAEFYLAEGGPSIGLNRAEEEDEIETGVGAVLTFAVPDIHEFRSRLMQAETEVGDIEEVSGGVMKFNFWDPEGNPFEVMKA